VSDAAAGNNVVLSFADYTLLDNANVDVLKLAGSATLATGNHDAAGDQLWANFNPGESSTLTGESHNDVFVVFNPGDTVVGQPNSTDTVYSLVDFTLPANVDTLKLVGPTASHGTGNSDAAGDQLWANPGVTSTLTGESQNDVFVVFNTGDQVSGQPGANDTVYSGLPVGAGSGEGSVNVAAHPGRRRGAPHAAVLAVHRLLIVRLCGQPVAAELVEDEVSRLIVGTHRQRGNRKRAGGNSNRNDPDHVRFSLLRFR
jgi:hypothetical protein